MNPKGCVAVVTGGNRGIGKTVVAMRAASLVAVIALCLISTHAEAAGFRLIEVSADTDGSALTGAMWYPCGEPPVAIAVDSQIISGGKDCPVIGDRLPLVIVSHGSRGSFLVHRDTVEILADAGFVVAAINHPAPPSRCCEDRRRRLWFSNARAGWRRVADRPAGSFRSDAPCWWRPRSHR